MSYCRKKTERYWKDMQPIWYGDIQAKCSWETLYNYDFKENIEWTVGHYEQSPLCRIIWGEIISNYLSEVKQDRYAYIINRNALVVYNADRKEESYRFLFDVMYNLKSRYIKEVSDGEKYHYIGNFTPIPANVVLSRSLQFVHRDFNEDWSKMMGYLSDNWETFMMKGLTFEQYKSMTFMEEDIFTEHQVDVSRIKTCIAARGKKIQERAQILF